MTCFRSIGSIATVMLLFLLPLVHANTSPRVPSESFTLLIFQSVAGDTEDTLKPTVDQLHQTFSEDKLVIKRYTPEDKAIFEQYHIQKTPQYVLLDAQGQLRFLSTEQVASGDLQWQVREVLHQNEKLTVPQAFQHQMEDILLAQRPFVLVFKLPDQPLGEAVMKEALETTGNTINLFSFDPCQPEVMAWMNTLGLHDVPSYVVVSPSQSLFRKSSGRAQSWRITSDLQHLQTLLNSPLESILANNPVR